MVTCLKYSELHVTLDMASLLYVTILFVIRDDTNNVTYPRINFCIPLLYIWQPLSDYIATKGDQYYV